MEDRRVCMSVLLSPGFRCGDLTYVSCDGSREKGLNVDPLYLESRITSVRDSMSVFLTRLFFIQSLRYSFSPKPETIHPGSRPIKLLGVKKLYRVKTSCRREASKVGDYCEKCFVFAGSSRACPIVRPS